MTTQDFDGLRALMGALDRAHTRTHALADACEREHPEQMSVIRGAIDAAMWVLDDIIEKEFEWAEEARAEARAYARHFPVAERVTLA